MNSGIYALGRADGRNPSRPWASSTQATEGADGSVAINAATGRDSRLAWWDYAANFNTSTGNSGGVNPVSLGLNLISNTTANGFAVGYLNFGSGDSFLWSRFGTTAGVLDWRRRRGVVLRVRRAAGNNAAHRFRIQLGQTANGMTQYNSAPGRGIGCEIRNNRFFLYAHNGTTETSVDSGVDYVTGVVDITVESDGLGNAFLSVDGQQIATNPGAPFSLAAKEDTLHVGVSNGGATENNSWWIYGPRFLWS